MNKKFFALLLLCALCGASAFAQGRKGVRINEVMVQNDSSYVDDYGMHHAWIELFNSTFAPVDISSMYLTDDPANPKKYPIPRMDVNTEMPARQHVVFWADNEPNKGTFHLNFFLKPGKDNYIGLYDSDGKTLVDEVVVPASLGRGHSYARKQDGVRDEADDKLAWEVRDGSNEKYITPSSNNIILDTNEKIKNFEEHDQSGLGMTVLAMAVVFAALIVLSLCFNVIGWINAKTAQRKKKEATAGNLDEAEFTEGPDSGEEIAAVCMALHEHLNMHDKEDLVLTINKVKRSYSPWSSKIYSLRELPRR
ncbi:MAG TPA: OadG family protein [Candidatus Limisoma intestinavium]|uniref:OadG family protein n=1 Tax=Candidatus Limisoma intestinavium TaxID=2840856 RepID=A0A9D1IJI7_9BACT|nr:OadG family protein [Candidatus Limisoma intestinavium]